MMNLRNTLGIDIRRKNVNKFIAQVSLKYNYITHCNSNPDL